jgi:hypothetical protein
VTHHVDNLRVHILRNHTPLRRNPVQHLRKRLTFDLLRSEFGRSVVEIENDGALVELLEEEFVTLDDRDLWKWVV